MTLEVDGKPLVVILAPAPRMEFRDLTEDMLKPGMTLTVVAYRSKARAGEFRAQSDHGREADVRPAVKVTLTYVGVDGTPGALSTRVCATPAAQSRDS